MESYASVYAKRTFWVLDSAEEELPLVVQNLKVERQAPRKKAPLLDKLVSVLQGSANNARHKLPNKILPRPLTLHFEQSFLVEVSPSALRRKIFPPLLDERELIEHALVFKLPSCCRSCRVAPLVRLYFVYLR